MQPTYIPDTVRPTNRYKIADWIHNLIEGTRDICAFSGNFHDGAIDLLLENSNRIYFPLLSGNPNDRAVDILFANPEKIENGIYSNPNPRVVHNICMSLEKIDFVELSKNPSEWAVDYLLSHQRRINFNNFSLNTNDKAVKYLLQNKQNLGDRYVDNSNDLMVDYILSNFNIRGFYSKNENPRIVRLFEEGLLRVDGWIYSNNSALHVAKKYYEEKKFFNIPHIEMISKNSNIFEVDMKKLKTNFLPLKKEIIQESMQPRRVERALFVEQERLVNLGYTEEEAERICGSSDNLF